MKKLDWYVYGEDGRGNVEQYAADIRFKVTDSIKIYIRYLVHRGNDEEWYFSVIQTSPSSYNNKGVPSWVKCYEPEIGMKMAQDEFNKLIDGFKKVVSNMEN